MRHPKPIMAQPGRTAQGNRLGPMHHTRPSAALNSPILRAILVAGGTLSLVLGGGCSSGESGLVLGRPQPELLGGTASLGGTGATGDIGGDPALIVGGEPGGAGTIAEAGSGSGLPEPTDPTWIGEACTPTIAFENRDTTAQGQLFTDAVPDPPVPMWAASHAACRLLYRSAGEVKPTTKVSLVVEDRDGIASTAGTLIRLSTRYLKTESDRGVDLRAEITGILHFATSLVFQNSGSDADPAPPSWLVVGIADYVRLESGYIDRAERAKGGSFDGSGSQTTAFFLDYLATKNPTVVMQLNQRLAPTSPVWTNDVFQTLMGSDVETLWAAYQSTL
jgi:hypothetical protein